MFLSIISLVISNRVFKKRLIEVDSHPSGSEFATARVASYLSDHSYHRQVSEWNTWNEKESESVLQLLLNLTLSIPYLNERKKLNKSLSQFLLIFKPVS